MKELFTTKKKSYGMTGVYIQRVLALKTKSMDIGAMRTHVPMI